MKKLIKKRVIGGRHNLAFMQRTLSGGRGERMEEDSKKNFHGRRGFFGGEID